MASAPEAKISPTIVVQIVPYNEALVPTLGTGGVPRQDFSSPAANHAGVVRERRASVYISAEDLKTVGHSDADLVAAVAEAQEKKMGEYAVAATFSQAKTVVAAPAPGVTP